MSSKKMSGSLEKRRAEHWRRTRSATFVVLAIWAFFSIIVHVDALALNNADFLGFPFGYWFAVQGSLIAFVVLIFVHNRVQDRIDDECGMSDEDDS